MGASCLGESGDISKHIDIAQIRDTAIRTLIVQIYSCDLPPIFLSTHPTKVITYTPFRVIIERRIYLFFIFYFFIIYFIFIISSC